MNELEAAVESIATRVDARLIALYLGENPLHDVKRFLGYTMKPTDRPKVTVLITHPIPLEQLKKYASTKPLRRPAPRSKR